MLSKIIAFWTCVSRSWISRPLSAAMTASPSSYRPLVSSHLGDSGSQIMPMQRTSAKTIWKVIGKRQVKSAEPLRVHQLFL